MFGVIDTEYIGLKYSSTGIIFEAAFLLLDNQRREIHCYKWNIRYNMYKYEKNRWSPTLNFINRNGFYAKTIRPHNENGYEIKHVQEEIQEICSFFGVQAVYVKGNVPTDKLLLEKCDKNIALFNLEDFKCEKYLHSVHDPEDEVRYFAQWIPEKIPDMEKCIRYPKS